MSKMLQQNQNKYKQNPLDESLLAPNAVLNADVSCLADFLIACVDVIYFTMIVWNEFCCFCSLKYFQLLEKKNQKEGGEFLNHPVSFISSPDD